MNARSLKILENTFAAEVDGAINKHSGLFQTKNNLAKQLVEDGYLEEVTEILPGRFPVKITGYALTHLGRITYCLSAGDEITDGV